MLTLENQRLHGGLAIIVTGRGRSATGAMRPADPSSERPGYE
jgi:hypothetical protein